MDIRLLGDDNREKVVDIPMITTIVNVKQIIADALIIPNKHIMELHIEKMIVPTNDDDKEEYIDIFKSIDLNDKISMSKYLKSGDTIYINNVSSFSDPNVWKLDQEWNALMDISSTLNKKQLMEFIELLTRVCENIIENPQNERYRHLNFQKIKTKIENIPNGSGLKIFNYIGFFLKPNDKDFNFYVMHSLHPLKHILKCIYLKFPELRPKDAKFMTQFESFDTQTKLFEVEKKAQEQNLQQMQEEKKEYFQNLQPNQEAIIPPSTGTRIANIWHVLVENAMLIALIVPIVWWLFKAVFWPYFR